MPWDNHNTQTVQAEIGGSYERGLFLGREVRLTERASE